MPSLLLSQALPWSTTHSHKNKILRPRAVLVQAVLSSFPIYAMCSILLPKGIIDYLDSKRRSFLWMGETTCSGADCKALWELVCLPKSKCGLGLKDLLRLNQCLLQKFLYKLHEPPSLPWQRWFASKYGWNANSDFGDLRRLNTAVWRAFRKVCRISATPPMWNFATASSRLLA